MKTVLPAIGLTGSTKFIHLFGRFLILIFLAGAVLVAFAPWRQFVGGSGQVIAFDPLERRVNLEALVSGRVKKLYVVEGQKVKAGELLAELQDNDPNLLVNLQAKQLAAENRIEFAKSRLEALETQMTQQKRAKEQALQSAKQTIAGADVAERTARLDYDRVNSLFKQGLASRRDYEQAVLKRDGTVASLRSAEANLFKTESDFNSSIASLQASIESARSAIASTERDLVGSEIKVSQTERQQITAPRDGIVLKVLTTDGSYLKPGDPVCVIIPETESRFVEVWMDGNDVPLLKQRREENGEEVEGSPVRLAFEGWPSLQAAGWPQLAIGTFAGELIFIDATDDGTGRFRVVVGPKVDVVDRGDGPQEVTWPAGERFLRQGVKAKAWVMLEEVPLWFELWRQINGFPPTSDGLVEAVTKKK